MGAPSLWGFLLFLSVAADLTPAAGFVLGKPTGSCPPISEEVDRCLINQKDECQGHNDCGWNEMCCSNGCTNMCVPIRKEQPIFPPNPPRPFKPPGPPKPIIDPRSCPPIPTGAIRCLMKHGDQCQGHNDCGWNQMCCSNGCTKTCVTIRKEHPIFPPNPPPPYKPPGPPNPIIDPRSCPPIPEGVIRCLMKHENQCQGHNECGWNEMCCSNGCTKTCVPIRKEHPFPLPFNPPRPFRPPGPPKPFIDPPEPYTLNPKPKPQILPPIWVPLEIPPPDYPIPEFPPEGRNFPPDIGPDNFPPDVGPDNFPPDVGPDYFP